MSQNHQTCIDRVWGNLDDLDNAHNIWLKDLQQRRQTRHLSLVNPIHFIPSTSSKMLHASSCETIGLLDHHIFRTIKSLFVFPPSLPYNRGGKWKPIHSNNAPKPMDASSRLDQKLYRSHMRYQNPNHRQFPPIEKESGLRLRLIAAWIGTTEFWISRFLGSNNKWQEIYIYIYMMGDINGYNISMGIYGVWFREYNRG